MFNLSKIDVEFNFSSTQQRNFQTETQMFCIHRKVPETSKYAMLCQMIDSGLIIVMDLLNSFRDGHDLNLRQLDNISDAVLLDCRFTWAERIITTPVRQIHLYFISSIQGFASYSDCTYSVFLWRLAHTQIRISCTWLGFEVEL